MSKTYREVYTFHTSQTEIDPEWDHFVNQVAFGHHVQTSMWSRLKIINNWGPLRLIVSQNQCYVAGLQMFLKRIPLVGNIAYASNGPVFATDSRELRGQFIQELRRTIKKHNIRLLFLQPGIGQELFVDELVQAGYKVSKESIAPLATVLIDLTQDLETINKQIKKSKRRGIRYAEQNGICIREGNADDVELFHRLLCATSRRQGFDTHSLAYYQQLYEVFEPGGHIKLLFAEHNHQAISGMLLIGYADTVVSKKAGWTGEKSNLRPNEALEWGAIQWAKAQGYRYYDLEGIDRDVAMAILTDKATPDIALETPAHYKLSYGGEVRLLPQTYSYSPNPVISWLYHRAYPKIAHHPAFDTIMRMARGHSLKAPPLIGLLPNVAQIKHAVCHAVDTHTPDATSMSFSQASHFILDWLYLHLLNFHQQAIALVEHLPS